MSGEWLRRSLRELDGSLSMPGSSDYQQKRRVWNGTIDRRPVAIVTCASERDVAAVIRTAREHDVLLAVRGGGHSLPGFSSVDDGIVLDLAGLRAVEVDATSQVVTVGGGARWGDVDPFTHSMGFATTGGIVSSTGVGGFTLGGGIGWLSRWAGLACDNLLAATVVDAEGTVHRVDSTDPDWLWGLRGGGGNFGVVTSFELRLHPLSTVVGGTLLFSLDRADEVVAVYREWVDGLDDKFTTMLSYLLVPDDPDLPDEVRGRPALAVLGCHVGSDEAAERDLAAIRGLGPSVDLVDRQPYPVLQRMVDPDMPAGRRYYFTGVFTAAFSDGMRDALRLSLDLRASSGCSIDVHHMGGAAGRVPAEATAFSGRSAAYTLNVIACWDEPADDEPHRTWVRETAARLRPFQAGGDYVNFMGDHRTDRQVQDAYGRARYERLVALKRRVDPDNLFRLNQNVVP